MNLYNDNNGKWHTDYMAKCKALTIESLEFIRADCREAIEAMPENPKCEQYMDEINYCSMELVKRKAA